MNNKKTTTMIAIGVMIVVNLGMVVMTFQKVTALLVAQNYQQGVKYADSLSERDALIHLGSSEFQTHSIEYRNGYIGELDHKYGLTLPYVEYRNDPAYGDYDTDPDVPINLTPHFMDSNIVSK